MSARGDFWSRRKARVAQERDAEDQARVEAEATARAEELAERSDEEILAEFGLPDPDKLEPGDGIAGFMRREIPERLRRRAMRRLWRSNPVLACLDGLNDYDDDYTNAVTDMPGVKSAYQVGKGMAAHVEEMARAEAVAASKDAPQPAAAEAPAEPASEPAETTVSEPGGAAEENAQVRSDTQQSQHVAGASTTKVVVASADQTGARLYTGEESTPRPRRMRFSFEERE